MFMAGAAFVKDQTAEAGSIMAADGMRGMTVIADRQLFIRLRYCGAMDRRAEFFSNTQMALGASLYNIIPVYT